MNTFNEVAKIYSNGRPGYPRKLYEFIVQYVPLSDHSTILEVGAGHGIATEEISDFRNPWIIALEPGINLCKLAKKRLEDRNKVSILNTSFEHFKSKGLFDAIFSATAFHWPNKSVKYKKAFELLKPNGFLIVYWNNYLVAEEDNFVAIQKIYQNYHPDGAGETDIRTLQRRKIDNRRREIETSRYFNLIAHHEIIYNIEYSGERYLDLLKSFSTNAKYGTELNDFYKKVADYVISLGNKITITITVNLEIGRKQ